MSAPQNSETNPTDPLDELSQIGDALKVVWCALTNDNHAEEQIVPIGNHVNDLANRLDDCQKALVANWLAGETLPPDTDRSVPALVPDTIDAMLARMSLAELDQTYDGLGTIHSVASGLLCQPRYQKRDSEILLNDAGGVIETAIAEVAADIRDRIVRLAETRPAKSKEDKERKFALLAGEYIDGLSEPKAALERITQIVANLGKGGAS